MTGWPLVKTTKMTSFTPKWETYNELDTNKRGHLPKQTFPRVKQKLGNYTGTVEGPFSKQTRENCP